MTDSEMKGMMMFELEKTVDQLRNALEDKDRTINNLQSEISLLKDQLDSTREKLRGLLSMGDKLGDLKVSFTKFIYSDF